MTTSTMVESTEPSLVISDISASTSASGSARSTAADFSFPMLSSSTAAFWAPLRLAIHEPPLGRGLRGGRSVRSFRQVVPSGRAPVGQPAAQQPGDLLRLALDQLADLLLDGHALLVLGGQL